jgi:ADP-glucose pyrophosphorylase
MVISDKKFVVFLWRNCIIDKNAKIGKDVIIMNKDVSNLSANHAPICSPQ